MKTVDLHRWVSTCNTLSFIFSFFFPCYSDRRGLHSFPTRRSSDLRAREVLEPHPQDHRPAHPVSRAQPDRKSTRLNSSHVEISYAVFCVKKKSARNGGKQLPGRAIEGDDAGRCSLL